MSEDKQQKSNVPELRFPEFEGEWEEKKLGEICTFASGGTPLRFKTEYWNGNIPWITTGDINGKEIKSVNNFITKEGLDNSSAKLIEETAILLAMYGQGKTRGMSSILNFPATTNQACAILKTKENYNFLHQFLLKNYYKLRFLANEGSQKNLSLSLLKEFKVFITNYNEQQKIGNFFSKLDRQIELEEKKLALLEEQKKGYMQKIFSQGLRFKDENGNDYTKWKQVTIAEITSYVSSKKSSNQYNENESIQGYPVYDAIREIGKESHYDMRTPYISILKDGAGVGRLNLRQGKSSVIGTMSYLLPHNTELKFLYYCLKMLNFKKYIIGSTIPHLYYKDYSKEKVFVPTTLEEQEKIGRFVFKLDASINNKSRKIELLKLRKKGLLQKIFI
ncbi:restriction endonuclease subunit S [Staphylococcus debuckii]|uniref:Restriction endonuclease subunit S n=1 Tax=Staphylococcus debuckii TaxID=2044912 RepID=A0ABU9EUX9_9STAP